MRARPFPSRKFKRDHVCAICDGRHRLTLADFGNTSHVNAEVRARTRMIPGDGHEFSKCENPPGGGIGDDGGDFAYFQVGCGHVTCRREGNRLVLIAGPDCQLATSGGLDMVTVAVSSKKDEKH